MLQKNRKDKIIKHTSKRVRRSRYVSRYREDYFSQEFKKLLEHPELYIKPPHLKTDATTTVTLTEINGNQFVIKCYHIKHLWHSVKRAVQPTRAARCWRNAFRLLKYGIPTPKPIAMIERRVGVFRREGYYIYEYIPGPQGFDAFRDSPATEAVTNMRAKKTAKIIKKMLDANISHGDLKASNFIYAECEPYFIDLDAMRYHRFTFFINGWQKREIDRFLKNWLDPKTLSLFSALLKG